MDEACVVSSDASYAPVMQILKSRTSKFTALTIKQGNPGPEFHSLEMEATLATKFLLRHLLPEFGTPFVLGCEDQTIQRALRSLDDFIAKDLVLGVLL